MRKNFLKSVLSLFLAFTMFVMTAPVLSIPEPRDADEPGETEEIEYRSSGLTQLPKLSKMEIAQLLADNPGEEAYTEESIYDEEPSFHAPYSLGKVKDEYIEMALGRFNAIRRLAGLLPAELTDEMNTSAQYGAVLEAATGYLTHVPGQPADMDDDFYDQGYKATNSCSISGGVGLIEAVEAFTDDSDPGNISFGLGHRIAQLHPYLKYTGFGYCDEYGTEKVLDRSQGYRDFDFISWPATGYMPNNTRAFNSNSVWSIEFNTIYYAAPDGLTVTITSEKTGRIWVLKNWYQYSPGVGTNLMFDYDNFLFFRPGGVDHYEGVYTVRIDGLKDRFGNEKDFVIRTEFFDPGESVSLDASSVNIGAEPIGVSTSAEYPFELTTYDGVPAITSTNGNDPGTTSKLFIDVSLRVGDTLRFEKKDFYSAGDSYEISCDPNNLRLSLSTENGWISRSYTAQLSKDYRFTIYSIKGRNVIEGFNGCLIRNMEIIRADDPLPDGTPVPETTPDPTILPMDLLNVEGGEIEFMTYYPFYFVPYEIDGRTVAKSTNDRYHSSSFIMTDVYLNAGDSLFFEYKYAPDAYDTNMFFNVFYMGYGRQVTNEFHSSNQTTPTWHRNYYTAKADGTYTFQWKYRLEFYLSDVGCDYGMLDNIQVVRAGEPTPAPPDEPTLPVPDEALNINDPDLTFVTGEYNPFTAEQGADGPYIASGDPDEDYTYSYITTTLYLGSEDYISFEYQFDPADSDDVVNYYRNGRCSGLTALEPTGDGWGEFSIPGSNTVDTITICYIRRGNDTGYDGPNVRFRNAELHRGAPVPVDPTPTPMPAASGECGENVTWSFDPVSGELVISGTGDMNDYRYNNASTRIRPWEDLINKIRSVTVEEGVTGIGIRAFDGAYEKLTSVSVSGTVTSIREAAFGYCRKLENIDLSYGLQSIGQGAFQDCDSLASIDLPESLLTIGSNAFNGCDSLFSIDIPDSVTVIQGESFSNCSELREVHFGSGLTEIDGDFNNCAMLEEVTIPANVTLFGGGLFSRCDRLVRVYFEGAKPVKSPNNSFIYPFQDHAEGLTVYYLPENADSWTPNGETEWMDVPIEPYGYEGWTPRPTLVPTPSPSPVPTPTPAPTAAPWPTHEPTPAPTAEPDFSELNAALNAEPGAISFTTSTVNGFTAAADGGRSVGLIHGSCFPEVGSDITARITLGAGDKLLYDYRFNELCCNDSVTLYVNGVPFERFSGVNTSWSRRSFTAPQNGTYTFRWSFCGLSGEEACYMMDDVRIVRAGVAEPEPLSANGTPISAELLQTDNRDWVFLNDPYQPFEIDGGGYAHAYADGISRLTASVPMEAGERLVFSMRFLCEGSNEYFRLFVDEREYYVQFWRQEDWAELIGYTAESTGLHTFTFVLANDAADAADFGLMIDNIHIIDPVPEVTASPTPEPTPTPTPTPIPADATLNEALNAEGGALEFTASGNKQFYPADADDRIVARIDGRAAFADSVSLSTNVSMNAGDCIFFDYYMHGDGGASDMYFDLRVNGSYVLQYYETKDVWTRGSFTAPETGEYTVQWRFLSNIDDSFCMFDNIFIMRTPGPSLSEALNVDGGNIEFTTSGMLNFAVTTDGGRTAAYAVGIQDDPRSYAGLNAVVHLEPGERLCFDYRFDGGNTGDYFTLAVNNSSARISCADGLWHSNTFTAEEEGDYGMYIRYHGLKNESWLMVDNVRILGADEPDPTSTPTIDPVIPGDASGDGVTNINDAIIVLRAAIGLIEMTPEIEAHCDVNHDGSINVTDALIIIRFVMGLISEL